MSLPLPITAAPFRPVDLASLRAAEAFYDGPFSIASLVSDEERQIQLAKAALLARSEARAKFRAAIRFARQHRAQARPDLASLMLREAAAHRAGFRYWNHRFVAIRAKGGARDDL
jgi:hypothetical protein